MSFILNALKKAEQDRLRDDPKDLEDFASARWDPYEQKPSSNKSLIVFSALVVLILSVVVLFYFIDDIGFKQNNSTVKTVETEINPEAVKPKQLIVEQPQPIDPMAIPKLNISGHMFFAQGSSSNRLFANDQSYKEGDLVSNGWVLMAIELDGIKLKKNEKIEFLSYP